MQLILAATWKIHVAPSYEVSILWATNFNTDWQNNTKYLTSCKPPIVKPVLQTTCVKP